MGSVVVGSGVALFDTFLAGWDFNLQAPDVNGQAITSYLTNTTGSPMTLAFSATEIAIQIPESPANVFLIVQGLNLQVGGKLNLNGSMTAATVYAGGVFANNTVTGGALVAALHFSSSLYSFTAGSLSVSIQGANFPTTFNDVLGILDETYGGPNLQISGLTIVESDQTTHLYLTPTTLTLDTGDYSIVLAGAFTTSLTAYQINVLEGGLNESSLGLVGQVTGVTVTQVSTGALIESATSANAGGVSLESLALGGGGTLFQDFLHSGLNDFAGVSPGTAFTGDGSSDILWHNANGDTAIWLQSGGVNFAWHDLGAVPTSWNIAGVGDFDGDGRADLLWRNSNGDTALWVQNAGSLGFASTDLGKVPNNWSIQSVGDFNGDGKADILWRSATGDVDFWLSGHGSGFTGFTGTDLGVVSTNWSIQQVGDFNGDGKADILWRETGTGDTYLWASNQGADFSGFTGQDLGRVPTNWNIQGIGDLQGGGKEDIIWRSSAGDVMVWLAKAGSGFTGVDLGVVTTDWTFQQVGDFNGDGKADIAWRNASGDVYLWESNAGPGFTGYTGHDVGVVGHDWHIL